MAATTGPRSPVSPPPARSRCTAPAGDCRLSQHAAGGCCASKVKRNHRRRTCRY